MRDGQRFRGKHLVISLSATRTLREQLSAFSHSRSVTQRPKAKACATADR
ncbi:MAG: hypothetical protein F6J98_35320 [Moorea sp. SIO4G2]|nr:hypothetical protein [Moorena sp. SIO4G2]